ncbi:hypothetical protein [Streptomyces sp. NPDC048392]|uniref:hypothetical protein n=1 Tax=Streptomyces sp. NPDC048392 TaxID=3365543 RepID=UPI003713F497
MRLLSSPVLGCAAEIAKNVFSKSDLRLLLMKAGIDGYAPRSPYSKQDLITDTMYEAKRKAAPSDSAARQGLAEFVRLVAERVAPADPYAVLPDTPFWQLREALRADGFDLRTDYTPTGELTSVRLLPLDEPKAPLSDQITALEADFDRLGMTVAKNLYRQAVDNLVEQRFEAANGQMRSTFEAVIVHVATSRNFTSTKQGDGGPALAYLIDQGHLPERNGGAFIRGLWWITHTNGPHPGTSDAGEAYFRVQAITSAVRYLIDRFMPRQ